MSGVYDLTLPAGAADRIPALGELCKIISAPQGAVRISLDFGEQVQLLEGQGVRKKDGQPFRDVLVRNVSGTAQTVTLFIGDSRFEDSRITGLVSIVDTSRLLAEAGNAFGAACSFKAVTAGKCTRHQLWNPAASGKKLIVNAISWSVGVSDNVLIGWNLAMETLVGGGSTGSKVAKAGFPTSAATIVGAEANSTVAGVTQAIYSVSAQANVIVPYQLTTPMVLLPGSGLCVTAASALTQLLTSWEYQEFSA